MLSSHFFKLVGLASLTSAHFFLETPIAIGFDDLTLTEAPCGGFDPTDRSAGVTEWPVLGYPIALITTHLNVNWTFRAALLSDVTNWVDIFPRIHQTGIAEFCLPEVPGIEAWIGQDAVVQIIQEAPDGLLHQCAAVKFVAGGPAVPDDTCDNDPMISSHTTHEPQSSHTPSTTTHRTIPYSNTTPTAGETTYGSHHPNTTFIVSHSTSYYPTTPAEDSTTIISSTDVPPESSYHEITSGSRTVDPVVTTYPTPPPAYTGAADLGKKISLVAVLFALLLQAF
ncbi:hypothetical protein TWF106_006201 [Orbilia oligospora]|uniref:Copper acquisition factor BIM1-like domain-containing protein n=1 Tax=Orbilia oligospora TaxID=2813651 RepID=A0A7C8R1Q5_ORBOL|nr:hypothetical protein TWF106_006201 [Orbilia oligospora]KAF3230757.1 hypothetical protein TWF191_008601 [Orbilia oligospora]